MGKFLEQINFPYANIRGGQAKFMIETYKAIVSRNNLIISAPTGIGKTISALAPALTYAKKHNKTVICLTSRQTQANQIIKTIKHINQKSNENIDYVGFIGKKNMCVHNKKDEYSSVDFNNFCKKTKEKGQCQYYLNIKKEEQKKNINKIIDLSSKNFLDIEEFILLSKTNNFCPYEIAMKKANRARIIIGDFNYLFSNKIRENFLGKLKKSLSECILIVDEAHNLPNRIRNSYSFTLTIDNLKFALNELNQEVKTNLYDKYILNLKSTIEEIYFNKSIKKSNEYLLLKDEFIDLYLLKFENKITIKKIIEELDKISELILENKIICQVQKISNFLSNWINIENDLFLRLLEKTELGNKMMLSIKIKCIDPAEFSSLILNKTHASILMSATLSPISIYRDILGIKTAKTLVLKSPFEKQNQLTFVIDDVSTKYTLRNKSMYKKIAKHIINILNSAISKNAIIFFPSYYLMNEIIQDIPIISGRKFFREQQRMSKEQKESFVSKFKKNDIFQNDSKVLFAVTSGSFAEGLDLPDTALEIVIIVGLPLGIPNLYTKAVVDYFDKKYKKGNLYGNISPAINKIIQAAGRCIRTEKDRGIIALLDSRFLWPIYAQNFPPHWQVKKFKDYKREIRNFFNE